MRILEPFEDHFWEFYNSLPDQAKKKVDYVLQMVITLDRIPKQFFKHLVDGIYEIRIKSGSDIYRIFCFFDEGKPVILLNAIQKKTQKTPRKELERAKSLRSKYYESKDD
ncbi:MAG: type II toxin-antitoxin system RelE/ParE family toxin [Flavobacteriales bacterium]|nr:type II toxin-antitoxin system RelE/ParE family toxin [Flavobacteriales bacterium]